MPGMGSKKLPAWCKRAKIGNIGPVKVNQKMSFFRLEILGLNTNKKSASKSWIELYSPVCNYIIDIMLSRHKLGIILEINVHSIG